MDIKERLKIKSQFIGQNLEIQQERLQRIELSYQLLAHAVRLEKLQAKVESPHPAFRGMFDNSARAKQLREFAEKLVEDI